MQRSGAQTILSPAETWDLVTEPTIGQSIARDIAQVVRMRGPSIRIPTLTDLPEPAWVPEAAKIPVGDLTFSEQTIVPQKLGVIVPITEELERDSNPEATRLVGQSIGAAFYEKLDEALVHGATLADGATIPGLATAVPAPTLVAVADSWDPGDFTAGMAVAEARGTRVNVWLMNPADKTEVINMAITMAGAAAMLGVNTAGAERATMLGVPIVTTPQVPAGTIYGIPTNRVVIAVRDDLETVIDRSFLFDTWSLAVRAVLRVGVGFTDPAAIAKMVLTP